MKTPHESQVERARAPEPPVKDSFMLKRHKPTSFPAITACQTACTPQDSLARDFSVARLRLLRPWDRIHGFHLRSAVGAALSLEGFTRESLPRTGRATLMASSSTGEQWCEHKLAAGWSVPRPLGRLAPALPGPLHPTSTTPITFSMLALRRGYRTTGIGTRGLKEEGRVTERGASRRRGIRLPRSRRP